MVACACNSSAEQAETCGLLGSLASHLSLFGKMVEGTGGMIPKVVLWPSCAYVHVHPRVCVPTDTIIKESSLSRNTCPLWGFGCKWPQ